MATNVQFSRGSSVNFQNIPKDPNTLYFLPDSHEMYLGGEKYAFGKDITVVVQGNGDTIANATFDRDEKKLVLVLGEAGDAASVIELVRDAVAACVKTVTSDRGSSILVDDSDPENLKLKLNIAEGRNAGNVNIEECSDGLRASVEIPEDAVQGVDAEDKILKLDGKLLKTQLSITTVKENGATYVVLKGLNGVEVSRFDAAEFVKDGMLDKVELKYSSDGLNHRILVLTFNTEAGKEAIELDINDLVDVYVARENGGLREENNEFFIDNNVEASGPINTDVAPAFGEEVSLKAVKYDAHGLITGVGTFKFKMPEIVGGEVGGAGKLVTHLTVGADGEFSGETVDLVTALSASSTDAQVPTAKATWQAIEDARTVWEDLQ